MDSVSRESHRGWLREPFAIPIARLLTSSHSWIDGDTIILNPNIRWEHFLPPSDPLFSDIHFIGSQDWYGLNCGVFFMRVSEWSVYMLTDVSALPRLHPQIELYGQPDQNAMKHVFRWEGRPDNVIYEPRVWFNGYHSGKYNETEPRDGDLLVHFAGYYGNRTVAMGNWFDRVEIEPETLAIPFEETKVMGEIEEFWSRLWEAKTKLQEMTLELQHHNTTTIYKASVKLLDAIRYYPWDKKKLGDAMQKAENAVDGTIEKFVDGSPAKKAIGGTAKKIVDEAQNMPQSPNDKKAMAAGTTKKVVDKAQQVEKSPKDKKKSAGA